jgi:hypothetical protein
LLWSIIQKQPPPGQTEGTIHQQETVQGGLNIQTAMGLWKSYGPAFVNALQQGKDGSRGVSGSAPTSAQASETAQPATSTGYDANSIGPELTRRVETPASEK